MGERRLRKARFLLEHPYCIFCGGTVRAVEEDHVPSRQLFHRRAWPEGFSFPACERCNRITRNDEQVVAMLSRVLPDPTTEEENKELIEIIRAVNNNRPNVLKEMNMSANQKRAALRRLGSAKPNGMSTNELPFLNLGPLTHACVEAFARKLLIALHYRKTGQILTHEGGIVWRWYSNIDAYEGNLPDSAFRFLGGGQAIQRARKNLNEQFDFLDNASDDGEMGAYFAAFRKSFAVYGIVCMNENRMKNAASDDFDTARVLKPWPSSTS